MAQNPFMTDPYRGRWTAESSPVPPPPPPRRAPPPPEQISYQFCVNGRAIRYCRKNGTPRSRARTPWEMLTQ